MKRLSRSEFWKTGIEVRDLQPSGGFVIRLLDKKSEPPRVLTATQQPNHQTISVTSQPMRHVAHPESFVPDRYYGIGAPTPATVDTFTDQLKAANHGHFVLELIQS